MVVFDWKLARAWPRIVITADMRVSELNFIFLAGLPVQVVYRSEDAHRVNTIVELILKANPCFLATFCLDLIDTGCNARTLIRSYQEGLVREVA